MFVYAEYTLRNMATARALNRLTPACVNLGPTLTLTATIILVIAVITFIILIATCIYNYMWNANSTDATINAKKEKMIGGLVVVATIMVGVLSILSIWHIFTCTSVRRCIESS